MANKNRFTITDTFWQVSANGETIGVSAPVSAVVWNGDANYTKSSPTLTEDEQATIVHLFLAETFYVADDDALYACASADTYDSTGIEQVNFYYGGSSAQTVTEITQRIMPDGTKVQGYWVRIDNSNTAPTDYEDRTLYAEAIPRSPSVIPARVVSRTIRVMEDATKIHTVNLNAADLDLTKNTRIDYVEPDGTLYSPNLHSNICRYNQDNSTQYKAIDFVLTPGLYTIQSVSTFPALDSTDPLTAGYRRIRSSTGDKNDVTIILSSDFPGTTEEDADSFDPTWTTCSLRNGDPILFENITLDMYNNLAFTLGSEGFIPLVFNECTIKDSSMSYGKSPTGRQNPAIRSDQADDPGASTKNPYEQTLFRGSDANARLNVGLYNTFINTIVCGGPSSIFNCDGAIWWDTLYFLTTAAEAGVNNFRHITSYGPNASGTDLDTERYVSNGFGLSTGGIDVNGKYYYDYADSVGNDSIARGTCEISRITWVAEDGTFYATDTDVINAGKNILEWRAYLVTPPTTWPARYKQSSDIDGTYGDCTAGTRFYDFDFFVWKSGQPLTPAGRTFAAKSYVSSSACLTYVDDADWGRNPYPATVGNRVIDGNGKALMSWSNSRPSFPIGEGVDPLDPALPYMRMYSPARYDNPDGAPLFAAEGLDINTDTVAAYYSSGGLNPVTDTPANGLLAQAFIDNILTMDMQAGDRVCPIFWAHQDGVQTSNSPATMNNTLFHDYTSVMEQQFLFQASGAVSDCVFSNALFLDPKDVRADTLFKIEKPAPMRLGIKGTNMDNWVNMSTGTREADAEDIHLHIEGSSISQTDGTSNSSSPPGAFDVQFKDSALGTVGTFSTTWLGNPNVVPAASNTMVANYVSNSGNKEWGVSKYGAIEDGGLLHTSLVSDPVTLDLGSVLPYDIKGNPRTANSLPHPIDAIETGSTGNETITTLLPFNRFRIPPASNNATRKVPTDVVALEYEGELLENDAAPRSYKWMLGSTVVSTASSYTVQAEDVGKSLTCFLTADGVTEAIPFGLIKSS